MFKVYVTSLLTPWHQCSAVVTEVFSVTENETLEPYT